MAPAIGEYALKRTHGKPSVYARAMVNWLLVLIIWCQNTLPQMMELGGLLLRPSARFRVSAKKFRHDNIEGHGPRMRKFTARGSHESDPEICSSRSNWPVYGLFQYLCF